MQIETLEIRNYRLFREAKLADLPRLVVLVGANGSGKSTLCSRNSVSFPSFAV
jgi:predicted ATPase